MLAPANCVLAFIGMAGAAPPGLVLAGRRPPHDASLLLASAAEWFGVPQVYANRAAPGRDGDRAMVATFGAIAATGRSQLILAGLGTATCVAPAAIDALAAGCAVVVVEDWCGPVSWRAHDHAIARLTAAGARPLPALAIMLAWQRARGVCRDAGPGPAPQELHPVLPAFIAPPC